MNWILTLINNLAVILVLTYLVTQTKIYSDIIIRKNFNYKNRLLLIIVFGAFSIYGTLSGIHQKGLIINIRDTFPAIAGIIGGPIVGLGAGLIGGIHRYFYLSGGTQISCTITTILAGLFAGLLYKLNGKKIISIKAALIFMASLQVFDFGLSSAIGFFINFNTWESVKEGLLPMLLVNCLGIAVFIYFTNEHIKQQNIKNEKEKLDKEIEIASNIQMMMIPQIFPAFPERVDIDIFAFIKPSKVVGGDFYDYFFINENQLVFLIGDVSDKGIPAAMFMAKSRTLIRTTSFYVYKYSPESIATSNILELVNAELVKENELCMFLTLFFAILDMDTGKLSYCVAGHNPPFIMSQPDGVKMLEFTNTAPLGIKPKINFIEKYYDLRDGDTIFLYTDGITEAINSKDEEFSEKRLLDVLNNSKDKSPQIIINNLIKSVEDFTLLMPQSDDITVLALNFKELK